MILLICSNDKEKNNCGEDVAIYGNVFLLFFLKKRFISIASFYKSYIKRISLDFLIFCQS